MTPLTLPAIGVPFPLHGAILTRTHERRFRVQRINGAAWLSNFRCKHAEIALISAVNCARNDVGLPLLNLPCAECCANARASRSNAYCGRACEYIAQGETRILKRTGPERKPTTPYDWQPVIAALNGVELPRAGKQRRYIEERGIAPDYHRWYLDACALIARRETEQQI